MKDIVKIKVILSSWPLSQILLRKQFYHVFRSLTDSNITVIKDETKTIDFKDKTVIKAEMDITVEDAVKGTGRSSRSL
jgi:hypothetical protein